jgi:hypothetical protein
MSLATDIRAAWENGGEPPSKTSLLNFDIDPRSVPKSIQLSPAEQNQLAALKAHMRLVAKHDAFDASPQSLAAMVNSCTPRVRQAVALSREYAEHAEQTGGRTRLFEPKRELPKPDELDQRIIDRDAHERIVGGLHDRLNTREQQERIADTPPTMRDHVTASFDAAEQQEQQNG